MCLISFQWGYIHIVKHYVAVFTNHTPEKYLVMWEKFHDTEVKLASLTTWQHGLIGKEGSTGHFGLDCPEINERLNVSSYKWRESCRPVFGCLSDPEAS